MVLEGKLRISWFQPLPWAETPPSSPGCSALPGTGSCVCPSVCLWRLHLESLCVSSAPTTEDSSSQKVWKRKKKKSNKGGKAPLVLFQAWQEGPTTAPQPPAISRSCFNYPPCKPHFVSGSPSRHFLVVTLLAAEGAAANTSFYLEYMRTKDKWK